MERKLLNQRSTRQGAGYFLTVIAAAVMLFGGTTLFASESALAEAATQSPAGETVSIRGTIRNKRTNEPIAGVAVIDVQTGGGVMSAANGEFLMTVPRSRGKVDLQFMFLGMKPLNVEWSGQLPLNVLMEEDAVQIEAAVVMGTFERKAESFTGSAASYTTADLRQVGGSNALAALSTLDPSVTITPSKLWGSDPNRLPDIDIRGKGSIVDPRNEHTADVNTPLFILNGFEASLSEIVNIPTSQIASMTVLKDAAATAIYGPRAGNGVIVIETVLPTPGRLKVSYNGTFGVTMADLTDYNLMNAKEKVAFEYAAGVYNNTNAAIDLALKNYYNSRLERAMSGVDTYWLKVPLRTGFRNRHDIYVSGGDEAVTYGIGLDYANTQGVMKKSGNDVMGFRLNLSYRTSSFRFRNDTRVEYTKSWNNPVSFNTYASTNPYYEKHSGPEQPIYLDEFFMDDTGTYHLNYWRNQVPNPLYNEERMHIDGGQNLRFRNNFSAEWRPLDGLSVTGAFSIETYRRKTENFKSPLHTDYLPVHIPLSNRGRYAKSNTDGTTYSGNITTSYNKIFKDVHLVTANLIGNIRREKSIRDGYTVMGFADEVIPYPSYASHYPTQRIPYSVTDKPSMSLALNTGYTYNMRYAVDFTLTQAGTDNFGRNKRWTTTWATGVAWNIHQEDFAKDMFQSLRLRATIGNPGNSNSKYPTETTYTYLTQGNLFGSGIYLNQFGNPDLDWEKSLKTTAGIDFISKDRRLSLTFDVFQSVVNNLIIPLELPVSTGVGATNQNMGRNTIRGFDFRASYNIIHRPQENIVWRVGMTGQHKKSKYSGMEELGGLNDELRKLSSFTRFKNGSSAADIWAVRSAGIDQATGNEVFIQKDGTYTFAWDYHDEVKVGSSEPALNGTINTSVRYKNWTLDAHIRYILGVDEMNIELQKRVEGLTSGQVLNSNQDKRALYDRWQKPGDVAKFRRITDLADSMREDGGVNGRRPTDRFHQRKNWFEGESISVGYTFNKTPWMKKLGISNIDIKGVMNNIFTISSIRQERSLDYPFARTITLDLLITF